MSIRRRHHALAIAVYASQFILGFEHLFNVATPNSLIAATDHRVSVVWSIGLIITSTIALVGALGRDSKPLASLSAEGSGCLGLAILNGLYVTVLFSRTEGQGVVTTLTTLGILVPGLTCRFVQCLILRGRTERSLRSAAIPIEHYEFL